ERVQDLIDDPDDREDEDFAHPKQTRDQGRTRHLSISPTQTSTDPRIATESASLLPRSMMGVAAIVQNTGLRIFTRYGRSSPSPITKNRASPRESSVLAYPSPSARRGGFTRYGPVFGIFSRACRMILHDSFSSLNRHSNRAYESPAPPSCHTCGSKSISSYVS